MRWPALFRAVEKRQGHAPWLSSRKHKCCFISSFGEDQELLDLIVDQQRRLLGRKAVVATIRCSKTCSKQSRCSVPSSSTASARFYIQPNLVQRLAHTRLDIDPADIGLPFPFFMLVFDDPITRTARRRCGDPGGAGCDAQTRQRRIPLPPLFRFNVIVSSNLRAARGCTCHMSRVRAASRRSSPI